MIHRTSCDDSVLATRRNAYALHDLVHTSPSGVAAQLLPLLDEADPETVAVAGWALGRNQYDLGDFVAAERSLRRAAAVARKHSLADLVVRIRATHAAIAMARGASRRALRLLEGCDEQSDGQSQSQRVFVLHQLGRDRQAVDVANSALLRLRADRDLLGETRLLINRGISHLALDDLGAAEHDLAACMVLAEQLDQPFLIAAAQHNLAFLAVRRNDLRAALRLFDQARERYESLGNPGRAMAILATDVARVALSAGLLREALTNPREAVRLTEALGDALYFAEALLVAARSALEADEPSEASEYAARAALAFAAADREPWKALAEATRFDAELRRRLPTPQDTDELARLADILRSSGWTDDAAIVLLQSASASIVLGQLDEARRGLGLAKRDARLVSTRVHLHHAAAQLDLAEARPGSAQRRVHHGLRALENYRSSLASELRVAATQMAAPIVGLGLQVALVKADAIGVLALSERARAFARPIATPADDELERRLVVYRRVAQAVPVVSTRLAVAERAVIGRARQLGVTSVDGVGAMRSADVVRSLGERGLVSFTEIAGRLVAVTCLGSDWRIRELGAAVTMEREIAFLRSATRRVFAQPDELEF